MSALFLELLDRSLDAGWLIGAVLVLRLVLRRAPRGMICALWGLAALRLLLPAVPVSPLSLVPDVAPVQAAALPRTGLTPGAEIPASMAPGSVEAVADSTAGAGPLHTEVLGWIWLAGAAALLLYGLVSYLRLRRRVAEAVPLGEGIWLCDAIPAPFLLGLFRPRICLPSGLAEDDRGYVTAHERAHLARRDNWWKLLGFVLLAVYWFHPLVWAAYLLFCRDMELACDERVVRTLDAGGRRAYSTALLTCSVSRRVFTACPLAFGEVGVKRRVRAVLSYRKPAFWVVLAGIAACAAAAVCFLTDRAGSPELAWARSLTADQVVSAELVVMPQAEDRQYKKFAPEEIPDLVALINQSRGRPVDGEELAGQTISIYLTLTDGSVHQVSNQGNVYLVIDGARFRAGYGWLESWERDYGAGDAPLPPGWPDHVLTQEALLTLAQKGEALSWADFDGFSYTEGGSGLYIRTYPVEGGFTVQIGGAGPDEAPMYLTLFADADPEMLLDLRTGDVEAFLREHQAGDSVGDLFAAIAASPAEASSPQAYVEAHPEEYQALLDRGEETLRYLFSRFLEGGQTGLEGHLMRMVLDDLAPECQLKLAAGTGQEYFDAWLESAREIRADHGLDWMEEHTPAARLLLEMTGE